MSLLFSVSFGALCGFLLFWFRPKAGLCGISRISESLCFASGEWHGVPPESDERICPDGLYLNQELPDKGLAQPVY